MGESKTKMISRRGGTVNKKYKNIIHGTKEKKEENP